MSSSGSVGSKPAAIVLAAGVITCICVYAIHATFFKKKRNDEGKDDKLELPIVDLSLWVSRGANTATFVAECKKVSDALRDYGAVIVRDERVSAKDNDTFLDMMEHYFEISDGVRDARPEYEYQVGVTPANTECPRNHLERMNALGPKDKPLSPSIPKFDPKWRFFWRIGPMPPFKTKFPTLNMDPVVPPEIPEWKTVMDNWGNKMLDALHSVSEMAAVGFDLPYYTFSSKMKFGSHLLAPTGSDFSRYGQEGTVLAGFHYDLNFLTIHGKSRYPGLYIWTRQGKRMPVKIPDGCLLVQAGKQMEYLTGGHVMAGFHEVIVSKETRSVIAKKKREGKSLWRVSSTLFGHIQSDNVLEPLPPFANEESKGKYSRILAGEQVRRELHEIALDRGMKTKPATNITSSTDKQQQKQ